MKKRIMKGMLVACMLFIGFAGIAQTSSNPIGKWDYSMPDAPAEYGIGKAEFKMLDDKLVFLMTINGQTLGQPVEVKKNDNTYVIEISNDYVYLDISLNPDGDNLKGILTYEQWDLDILMTPEKQ